MAIERLPEVALALAAELLDSARALDAEQQVLPDGSFVSKSLGGRRYWYVQTSGGGVRHQRYLGPESEELLGRVERATARRAELEPERRRIQGLHDALVASGATAESPGATRVLELLAAAGFFRAGAVLVGTRAFTAIAARSGLRSPTLTRTEDFDLAIDPAMALAFPRDAARALSGLLDHQDAPFLPIPELDPKRPSTSFRIRRRDLRVDFLTPLRGRERETPVVLPGLGLAATPLRHLDYLIEGAGEAVAVGSRPVLVRVPHPGRFALHKLGIAGRRPATEAARTQKDRAQAALLIELLLEDRPGDLDAAASALSNHPALQTAILAESRRLPPALASELTPRLARPERKKS